MDKLSLLANVLRQHEDEIRIRKEKIEIESTMEICERNNIETYTNKCNRNESKYENEGVEGKYDNRRDDKRFFGEWEQFETIDNKRRNMDEKFDNNMTRNLRSRKNRENKREKEREKKYMDSRFSTNFESTSLRSFYHLENEKIENNKEFEELKYDEEFNKHETNEDKNISKDWEIAETPCGKYYLDFKSPYFTMNERIKILEAALEDIRERYYDTKDEYNKFNRKYSRRKRRATGSK